MAARRCSTCALNYPTSISRCHVCGEQTDWIGGADPNPDWEREVELIKSPPASEDERIEWWRMEYALSLGYQSAVAMSLAASDADMHVLEKLIRQGCTLELAARIV